MPLVRSIISLATVGWKKQRLANHDKLGNKTFLLRLTLLSVATVSKKSAILDRQEIKTREKFLF